MNGTDKTERPVGSKVALLGILVVALILAHLIVASRSAIILSKPIGLDHTGLSVSMPVGNGWESEGQWTYLENSFILSSSFGARSGKPAAWAHCRYLIAAEAVNPEKRLLQKASEYDATIVEAGRIGADKLVIDWAQMERPKTLLSMFFGTAELPAGRQVEIEVKDVAGEPALAGKVFRKIARSLSFEDNGLLENGGAAISGIKSKGLSSYLENQNRQGYFLIWDPGRRPIGFTMDVVVDSGAEDRLNVNAASLLYIQGRFAQEYVERVTSFQSDDGLTEFAWMSETINGTHRSRTNIVLDRDGCTTIRKSSDDPGQRSCTLSAAAIPSILLGQFLTEILDSNLEQVVVDVIEANGTIDPTLVSKVAPEEIGTDGEEIAYALKLEPLSTGGFFEYVYLDRERQISKRRVQGEKGYTFERARMETIAEQFPELAGYIEQKREMLQQGGSQN
jgi:hypothetical protein